MVTYAQRQQELINREVTWGDLDPSIERDAKLILASNGGKKAAKLVLEDFVREINTRNNIDAHIPLPRISAPHKVVKAMETVGVLEDVTYSETALTRRYALSEMGKQMLRNAVQRAMK